MHKAYVDKPHLKLLELEIKFYNFHNYPPLLTTLEPKLTLKLQ